MKNKLTRRKRKYKKNKKKSTRRNKIKMVGGTPCKKIINIPYTYLKNYHFHYKKKLYHLELDCHIDLLKNLKDFDCSELIKKINFIENDTFNIEGHEIKGSIVIHDKIMAITKELHKKLQQQPTNPYEKIIKLLKENNIGCDDKINLYRKDPKNIYFSCGNKNNFTLITLNTLNVLKYISSDNLNDDKFIEKERELHLENYMEYIKNFNNNIVEKKIGEINTNYKNLVNYNTKDLSFLKQDKNKEIYEKLLNILSGDTGDTVSIDYNKIFPESKQTTGTIKSDGKKTAIPKTAKDLYDFYVNYDQKIINLKSRENGKDQELLKEMNKFKDYRGMRDANEYYKSIVEDLEDKSNNYKTELIPKDECWNLTTPKFLKWSVKNKNEDTFGYKLKNDSNIINICTTKQGGANKTKIKDKITIDNNEYILLVVFDNPPGHHICYINIGNDKFVECNDSTISEEMKITQLNSEISNHNFLIYGKLNPNQKFERKFDTVKGIINNGATCFFNTAVQAFVHVTYFLKFLKILK